MVRPGRKKSTKVARATTERSLAKSGDSYWELSLEPIQILALVAPICIAYELSLALFLRNDAGGVITNRAHEGILRVFSALGVDGTQVGLPALSIPAVGVVLVLVLWQVIARKPWTIRMPVVAGMALESFLAAIPLYVAGMAIGLAMAASVHASESANSVPLIGRIGIALGAGLYEELLFRLALVSLLHALLKDACGLKDALSTWGAVVIAAIAFTIYHPLAGVNGAIDGRRMLFLFIAGLWFGALFVTRGFGIAVGAHAVYDILAVAAVANSQSA
ncbi:MAG: CPBP family intramembrane metalloprotease [Planctomycetota bacterium]|nr:CPBP family intramembrane metalloprotease [Planctomycetota bacterium]